MCLCPVARRLILLLLTVCVPLLAHAQDRTASARADETVRLTRADGTTVDAASGVTCPGDVLVGRLAQRIEVTVRTTSEADIDYVAEYRYSNGMLSATASGTLNEVVNTDTTTTDLTFTPSTSDGMTTLRLDTFINNRRTLRFTYEATAIAPGDAETSFETTFTGKETCMFEVLPAAMHEVTLQSFPNDGVTVQIEENGESQEPVVTPATITVTENADVAFSVPDEAGGEMFAFWSEAGWIRSDLSRLEVTPTGDVTYTAVFDDDQQRPDVSVRHLGVAPGFEGETGFTLPTNVSVALSYEISSEGTDDPFDVTVEGSYNFSPTSALTVQRADVDGTPCDVTDGLSYRCTATLDGSGAVTLSVVIEAEAEGSGRSDVLVTPNLPAADPSGDDNVGFFGFRTSDFGSIHGHVFEDVDGDGEKDPDETGFDNVFVQLFGKPIATGGEDRLVDSTFTMSMEVDGEMQHGLYWFEPLLPLNYEVRVVPPPGYVQSSPPNGRPQPVELNPGERREHVDFGVRGYNFPGIVRGSVYLDENENQQFDMGEVGLFGEMVYQDENANDQYDPGEGSTLTGGEGMYELSPGGGSLELNVVPRLGWVQTTDSTRILTEDDTINIGVRPSGGAIFGLKWLDLDGDGERDTDPQEDPEPGLGGWTVFLDLNRNTIRDPGEPTVVTDSLTGGYSFTDLDPGTYQVREQQQAGFDQTFPAPSFHEVEITEEGEVVRHVNFGNQPGSGVIAGLKWEDLDGDGERDTLPIEDAEPVLGGVTVYLDENGNGRLDPGERYTKTDPLTGVYAFTGLGAGTHLVAEIAGFVGDTFYDQTFPLNSTEERFHVVELDPDEVRRNVNFGNQPGGGTIAGLKWEDLDGDGERDTDPQEDPEPGLGGVTIYLDVNENGRPDPDEPTAVTNDFVGSYAFTNLLAGTYQVREVEGGVDDAFLTQTFPVQETGERFHEVELAPGEARRDVDFGNERDDLFTLSGIKFLDRNGDGVQDDDEPALDGWTIWVDGRVFQNTLTRPHDHDGDGEPEAGAYQFRLPAGRYTVYEDDQEGFEQTSPRANFVTSTHLGFKHAYLVTLGPDAPGKDFANQPVTEESAPSLDAFIDAINRCNDRPEGEPPCRIALDEFSGKRATVFSPQQALPSITRAMVIDGNGTAILDGSDAGGEANGLVLNAGNVVVKGPTLRNFAGHGILIDGGDNSQIFGNALAQNGGDGIRVASGTGNTLMGNTFTDNGGLAIDLGSDGPTPNDAGESDGVPNFPTIVSATSGSLTVTGALRSTPNAAFALDVFVNETCDDAGHGEGAVWLGTLPVTTDDQGRADFEVVFDTTFTFPPVVTATATGPDGGTSEFSQCLTATDVEAPEPVPPTAFRLHANYPNPFNPATTLVFDLPEAAEVRVEVFDLLGRRVLTQAPVQLTAGAGHTLSLDASALASGVYLYRLAAEGATQTYRATGRFVLVK